MLVGRRVSMAEAFTFFWLSRVSQWQLSPFVIDTVTFTRAEQFMMYAKALLYGHRVRAAQLVTPHTRHRYFPASGVA